MKKLIWLVVLLAGCATGPNRYEQEFQAYINFVNEEIRAGRLTRAQGGYLVAQKRNQLISQQQADQDRAIGAAAMGVGIMNSSGPYTLPRR